MLCFTGDQAGAEMCTEVLCSTRHVVQVSAGSLLWSVVHLPSHVCSGWKHQGAGTAHCLWCAQAHGNEEGGAAWWGETSYQPLMHSMCDRNKALLHDYRVKQVCTASLYNLSSLDERISSWNLFYIYYWPPVAFYSILKCIQSPKVKLQSDILWLNCLT